MSDKIMNQVGFYLRGGIVNSTVSAERLGWRGVRRRVYTQDGGWLVGVDQAWSRRGPEATNGRRALWNGPAICMAEIQSGLNPIKINLSSEKLSDKNLKILNPQFFQKI